jgi:hypothetical protein
MSAPLVSKILQSPNCEVINQLGLAAAIEHPVGAATRGSRSSAAIYAG